jgi:hypothetical protein
MQETCAAHDETSQTGRGEVLGKDGRDRRSSSGGARAL